MKRFGELGLALAGVWRTLAAVAGLLAILLIPVKLDELVRAYPVLRAVMTREAALIAFAIACVVYIAWIDLRGLIAAKPLKITEAARIMYNKASPGLRRLAVVTSSAGTKESPVTYFAEALGIMHEKGLVTLFGRRSEGLDPEAIPREYFGQLVEITDDGNSFSIWNSAQMDWYDLRVSKSDALKGLKEYEIDARRLELTRDPL